MYDAQRLDLHVLGPLEVRIVDVHYRHGGKTGVLDSFRRRERLVGDYRRFASRAKRDRTEAWNRGVAIEQFPVTEAVDQIDAPVLRDRIVDAEVEVLAERPGSTVLHLISAPAFRFGERRLGREALELAHGVVVFDSLVDQIGRAHV